MSKRDESVPAEKTITMTLAEFEAAKAEAAASAAVHVQRGQTFIEGMTEAAEERVEKILGKPRDPRKPWPMATASYSIELPGWAGPVTGTVMFTIRDIDSDGNPLADPIVTAFKIDWRLPPLEAMQATHGSVWEHNTFAPTGYGRRRPDIKEGVSFTLEFLQHVVKTVYEVPLQSIFQGKDLRFVKHYLTSELVPLELGEIRRETGTAGHKDRRAA